MLQIDVNKVDIKNRITEIAYAPETPKEVKIARAVMPLCGLLLDSQHG